MAVETLAPDAIISSTNLAGAVTDIDDPVVDVNASAVIAAMTTAPDATRQTLISNTITALKTAGVWDKLDCLWLCAAHAEQAATLNWKAPASNTLAEVGSTPFTADVGFDTGTSTGATNYLNTNFNPSTAGGNFAQNSACFFAWNVGTTSGAGSSAGAFDGTDGITIKLRDAGTELVVYRINQASAFADGGATLASPAGLRSVNRSGASAQESYHDGVLYMTGTIASTALNNLSLRLGTIGDANTPVAATWAAAGAGGSLTATEQDALYDALNAYLSGL